MNTITDAWGSQNGGKGWSGMAIDVDTLRRAVESAVKAFPNRPPSPIQESAKPGTQQSPVPSAETGTRE
jgi:hypothetical protein